MTLRRFGLRTSLAIVALSALAFSAEAARRRREFCLREASFHSQRAKQAEDDANKRIFVCGNWSDMKAMTAFYAPEHAKRERSRQKAIYHRNMVAMYRRTSGRFWEPTPRETSRSETYLEQAEIHATLEKRFRTTAADHESYVELCRSKSATVERSARMAQASADLRYEGEPAESWRERLKVLSENIVGHSSRAAHDHELANFHAAMTAKYASAASRPWLPVPPDPPKPE
jgi:hypothetical protein